MYRKRTWDEFLERANRIYGDRIIFLNPNNNEFASNKMIVQCKCNKCGNIMNVRVDNILFGKNRLKCCDAYECSLISQNEIIERLKKILGTEKYDFSLVAYKGMHNEVDVICKKHGIFHATPNNLLANKGCPKCALEKRSKVRLKSHMQYVRDCEKVHGKNTFIYLTKYLGYEKPISYMCTRCGKITTTKAGKHLGGTGCKFCHSSSLEREILCKLQEENVEYIHNYQIIRKQIDFYLPQYNIGIECQGKQHFTNELYVKKRKIENYDLLKTIKRDIEKYEYCKENNITLLYYFNKNDDFTKYIFDEKYKGIYSNENIFSDIDNLITYIKQNN